MCVRLSVCMCICLVVVPFCSWRKEGRGRWVACMHIHKHIHTPIHTRMLTYAHTYTYTHTHTHIHTHTHTHAEGDKVEAAGSHVKEAPGKRGVPGKAAVHEQDEGHEVRVRVYVCVLACVCLDCVQIQIEQVWILWRPLHRICIVYKTSCS